MAELRYRGRVAIMCLIFVMLCRRARWGVPAYTKEEVRELLSNNLRPRPPDSSDSAELIASRSFSNSV